MKTMTRRLLAAAALVPAVAQAHPGHAGLDQGIAHVVTSPDHLMAALLVLGMVAAAAMRLTRVETGAHDRIDN